jgi:hypothetical protein
MLSIGYMLLRLEPLPDIDHPPHRDMQIWWSLLRRTCGRNIWPDMDEEMRFWGE